MEIAVNNDCIVGGFNIFGIDEAIEVVTTAQELRTPVIIMINKQAVNAMAVEYWAESLKAIKRRASIPVFVHLDHSMDINIIKRAIKAGFDSVMFDGSQLSFEENIAITKDIVNFAHSHCVIVEAEIGAVGYSDMHPSDYAASITIPEEAKQFTLDTNVDWLAISIGNVHKMRTQKVNIDFDLLSRIESSVKTPLVIHGSTGIRDDDMKKLRKTHIAKANIGTALKLAFGRSLRWEFEKNPDAYDRMELFMKPLENLKSTVKEKMKLLNMENFIDRIGRFD